MSISTIHLSITYTLLTLGILQAKLESIQHLPNSLTQTSKAPRATGSAQVADPGSTVSYTDETGKLQSIANDKAHFGIGTYYSSAGDARDFFIGMTHIPSDVAAKPYILSHALKNEDLASPTQVSLILQPITPADISLNKAPQGKNNNPIQSVHAASDIGAVAPDRAPILTQLTTDGAGRPIVTLQDSKNIKDPAFKNLAAHLYLVSAPQSGAEVLKTTTPLYTPLGDPHRVGHLFDLATPEKPMPYNAAAKEASFIFAASATDIAATNAGINVVRIDDDKLTPLDATNFAQENALNKAAQIDLAAGGAISFGGPASLVDGDVDLYWSPRMQRLYAALSNLKPDGAAGSGAIGLVMGKIDATGNGALLIDKVINDTALLDNTDESKIAQSIIGAKSNGKVADLTINLYRPRTMHTSTDKDYLVVTGGVHTANKDGEKAWLTSLPLVPPSDAINAGKLAKKDFSGPAVAAGDIPTLDRFDKNLDGTLVTAATPYVVGRHPSFLATVQDTDLTKDILITPANQATYSPLREGSVLINESIVIGDAGDTTQFGENSSLQGGNFEFSQAVILPDNLILNNVTAGFTLPTGFILGHQSRLPANLDFAGTLQAGGATQFPVGSVLGTGSRLKNTQAIPQGSTLAAGGATTFKQLRTREGLELPGGTTVSGPLVKQTGDGAAQPIPAGCVMQFPDLNIKNITFSAGAVLSGQLDINKNTNVIVGEIGSGNLTGAFLSNDSQLAQGSTLAAGSYFENFTPLKEHAIFYDGWTFSQNTHLPKLTLFKEFPRSIAPGGSRRRDYKSGDAWTNNDTHKTGIAGAPDDGNKLFAGSRDNSWVLLTNKDTESNADIADYNVVAGGDATISDKWAAVKVMGSTKLMGVDAASGNRITLPKNFIIPAGTKVQIHFNGAWDLKNITYNDGAKLLLGKDAFIVLDADRIVANKDGDNYVELSPDVSLKFPDDWADHRIQGKISTKKAQNLKDAFSFGTDGNFSIFTGSTLFSGSMLHTQNHPLPFDTKIFSDTKLYPPAHLAELSECASGSIFINPEGTSGAAAGIIPAVGFTIPATTYLDFNNGEPSLLTSKSLLKKDSRVQGYLGLTAGNALHFNNGFSMSGDVTILADYIQQGAGPSRFRAKKFTTPPLRTMTLANNLDFDTATFPDGITFNKEATLLADQPALGIGSALTLGADTPIQPQTECGAGTHGAAPLTLATPLELAADVAADAGHQIRFENTQLTAPLPLPIDTQFVLEAGATIQVPHGAVLTVPTGRRITGLTPGCAMMISGQPLPLGIDSLIKAGSTIFTKDNTFGFNASNIQIIGDDVYVALEGDAGQANGIESGIFKSSAIFKEDGTIRGWTPWIRVGGMNDATAFFGVDEETNDVIYLTSSDGKAFWDYKENKLVNPATTVRLSNWSDGTHATDQVKASGTPVIIGTGLGSILEQAFQDADPKKAGLSNIRSFDDETPGFATYNRASEDPKFACMVATGYERVALLESGVFSPAAKDFTPTAEFKIDTNTFVFDAQTGDQKSLGLKDLGWISCCDFSRRTDSENKGWFFVGGEKGLAILANDGSDIFGKPIGSGVDQELDTFDPKTVDFPHQRYKFFGFKDSLTQQTPFHNVRKIVTDPISGYVYVLTKTALYRFNPSAEKIVHGFDAASFGAGGTNYTYHVIADATAMRADDSAGTAYTKPLLNPDDEFIDLMLLKSQTDRSGVTLLIGTTNGLYVNETAIDKDFDPANIAAIRWKSTTYLTPTGKKALTTGYDGADSGDLSAVLRLNSRSLMRGGQLVPNATKTTHTFEGNINAFALSGDHKNIRMYRLNAQDGNVTGIQERTSFPQKPYFAQAGTIDEELINYNILFGQAYVPEKNYLPVSATPSSQSIEAALENARAASLAGPPNESTLDVMYDFDDMGIDNVIVNDASGALMYATNDGIAIND